MEFSELTSENIGSSQNTGMGNLKPYKSYKCRCHHVTNLEPYLDIPTYTIQGYYPDILPIYTIIYPQMDEVKQFNFILECMSIQWLDRRWDQSCHRASSESDLLPNSSHPEIHGVCMCWLLASSCIYLYWISCFVWMMFDERNRNMVLSIWFDIVWYGLIFLVITFWSSCVKHVVWTWLGHVVHWIPGIGWLVVVVKTDDCLSLWIHSSWGSLL